MAVVPGPAPVPCTGSSAPSWVIIVLWVIVILAAVFIPLVLVIPLDTYRLVGNAAEVVSAFFCMGCCLYAYRYLADRIILPLAAFAFFGYALANIFWYLYSITLGRAFVFTSVSEIGFFCFFLFFISAITIEFPREKIPVALRIFLMFVLFLLPLFLMGSFGTNQPLHFFLVALRFLLIEQLVEAAIRHGVFRYRLLGAGLGLYCLGAMVYGLRETVVINNPAALLAGPVAGSHLSAYDLLSIVGPVSIGSFALITLGLFTYIRQVPHPPGTDAGEIIG
jgi:hypothetical protein